MDEGLFFGGESLLPVGVPLDSSVRETRQRIHLECVNYFNVDPGDLMSKKQVDNAWIDAQPQSVTLFSADTIEIHAIENFDLWRKDMAEISNVLIGLSADGKPHTLDEDLAVLEFFDPETYFQEEINQYFLLTAAEMPPQLINEAVFGAVGHLLREEHERQYPTANEVLQFMQQQGWVHYLNDGDSATFVNLLSRLQPDYEGFIEERIDFAEE